MTTDTRPVMTAAELREHHVADYRRDYNESDDGYSDMEAEEGRGWRALPSWGRDGWDLGKWPYVVLYKRERDDKPRFELMAICEGTNPSRDPSCARRPATTSDRRTRTYFAT